ncbi:MAG: HAMP domain-containing sensor histidine kinase [Lachnospiraceae bacterium]
MKTRLTWLSTGIVFILLLLTNLLSNTVMMFLSKHGWIPGQPGHSLFPVLVQTGIISIIIGTVLTLCIGHLPLRPINTLMEAIDNVAKGHLETKIHIEHPKKFRELSMSFNQMTDELSGIEMLRSDFVNNFSHEFKTPIVSILGFAKLLKKGNLSPVEQEEYLDIIIDESKRLAELAANVLNLSKVESISLLTNAECFNVSEQIRESIVLLDRKWSKKNISFNLNMDELQITGNENLLKQVWMNLIDNAIKFSPASSEIDISLGISDGTVKFVITDHGAGMDGNKQKLVFDKFFQGDDSHATDGNGLGLPLVKKIVKLHQGEVTLKSQPEEGSTIIVLLPV